MSECMPNNLHPMFIYSNNNVKFNRGHAMALGGVGILSTEFETPKKVISETKERLGSMRESFQRSNTK